MWNNQACCWLNLVGIEVICVEVAATVCNPEQGMADLEITLESRKDDQNKIITKKSTVCGKPHLWFCAQSITFSYNKYHAIYTRVLMCVHTVFDVCLFLICIFHQAADHDICERIRISNAGVETFRWSNNYHIASRSVSTDDLKYPGEHAQVMQNVHCIFYKGLEH